MKTAASAEAKMIIFLLLILPGVLSQDLVSFTPVLNYRRKGAVCMDGSPTGYFFQAGFGDGANNWHISIEGAGWCYSNTTCAAAGYHGSSRHMQPKKFSGMLSSSQSVNPDFYNWNQVLLHNCDGGFFYADAKHITATYNLQLQGLYTFESIMIDLEMRGLRTADNAILSGGLAALVNCDRFRGYILGVPTVKCLSDGGYYIYADNPAYNDTTVQTLAEAVQYQGLDDKYPPTCGEFSNSSCLFPQYFIDKIETPLFIINSVFDRYQIQNNVQPLDGDYARWKLCTNNLRGCTRSHEKIIADFGNQFLRVLNNLGGKESRGMYITSCYASSFILNEELWNSSTAPRLQNRTAAEALGDWFYDRSSVILIDSRRDFPVVCGGGAAGKIAGGGAASKLTGGGAAPKLTGASSLALLLVALFHL